MKPNFSEAVNWISTQDEADHLAKTLDDFVSYIKKQKKHVAEKSSSHIYVSSNLPIETAQKHHGCESWKSRKRKK